MRNNFLLFLCLLLLSGCVSGSLDTVPPYYGFPVEWENDRNDFPPDFPMDSITETDRDLDIAIIGEGFFQLTDRQTGDYFYTRLGRFSVDHEGRFAFYVELPRDNPTIHYLFSYTLEPAIVVPPDTQKILIGDRGYVWSLREPGTPIEIIGLIELATFAHPEGLQQVEENLYRETEASGPATIHAPGTNGTGWLKTQYLEQH